MSTNATVTIFDEFNDEPICTIYKHWDGYYAGGFGEDVRKFVSEFNVVNGIGAQEGKIANGMGCLAAQIIAHFKVSVGDVYMVPVGQREQYNYEIHYREAEEEDKDGIAVFSSDHEDEVSDEL